MTAVLYNCLLLKSRTLTDHEKTNLDHVGVSYIPHEEYVLIGPKGGDFTSPMTIELTHYHHLDNLAPSTQAPSNTVTVDNQTSEGHVEAQTVRDGAVENTMLHVAETVSEVTATEQAAAHSESQATQDTETSAVKTETVPMTETITTTTATTTKPKSTPNSNAHIWIYVGTAMIVFVLVAVMITIMCDQENDPKEDDDTDDTEMDDDRRIRLFGRATYSDIVCNNPNPIPIELMAIRERGINTQWDQFTQFELGRWNLGLDEVQKELSALSKDTDLKLYDTVLAIAQDENVMLTTKILTKSPQLKHALKSKAVIPESKPLRDAIRMVFMCL
ncbi:hypothetical protein D5F01_LYC25351 [Larimichthys crocea]|uniref:Uncharacterized protein n=1 Tax=Larimichthys crocea TaxID=215358 RepID=A0A644EYF4_LARCR|nr:hypothetical protein D5F01_LYC25351 [Larimichthys crocea]